MNKVFKNAGKTCILAILLGWSSIYTGYGQTTRVTMEAKDITLNELLSEIRKQTGYDFVFTSSKLDFNRKVSPKFKDVSMRTVLSNYFNTTAGVVYIIKNKTIILIDEDKTQDRSVHGQVLSAVTKQPIAGATVYIEEKKNSTKTDAMGRFLLNIPEYSQQLNVNFVGFKNQSVSINASAQYRIELEEATENIDEVIVTGLFNRSAESFTGASKTISGDEIRKISVKNVFSSISALDPSFRIVYNNTIGGDINQLPQIQMRGENSLPNLTGELSNDPTAPLFVLDGFEVSLQRIVDLDINLVESITLLKDASATAIYGSRGANGVLVIATIPPKPGKIQVSFSNDFSLTTPQLSVYNLLNAKDKLEFERRAGVYSADSQTEQYRLDVLQNERYKMYLQGNDVDWKAIPVQTGYSNRSSIRLEGGDQAIRYGIQLTGDLQQGVMKKQNRNNYSGQIDLTYMVKKLRFTNSLRVLNNMANNSPYGGFSQYISANPYHSPYDGNGELKQYLEQIIIEDRVFDPRLNPLYDTKFNTINKSGYFGVTNNFSARYTVLRNLFLESNLSLTKQTSQSDQFYSALDSRFANTKDLNRKGSYRLSAGSILGLESTTTVNYNLHLNKNQIFTTLGMNLGSNSKSNYVLAAEGFPSDQLNNLLFASQYESNGRPYGDESTVNRVGFVSNVNYSYDNRFLADLSVRRDGSSQYGTDRRFGNFWSTGIGWNIHQEKFAENISFLNRFKLRSSYGITGSLNIPAYASQYRYSFSNSSAYYGDLGGKLSNMGNPELTWQSVYKLNFGTDISIFDQRLTITADVYRERTTNAITSVSLAPSIGFSSYSENLGELRNQGFEFSTRYVVLKKPSKRLLWSVHLNGFTNSNILVKLSNRLASINDELNSSNFTQTVPNILLKEGESVNTLYAVRSLGVDPATGSEVYLTKNNEMTYVWNAADKVPVGITQPKWNGNFGTNLSYKEFDLNLIFNYQFGGQIYNQTLIDRVESVNPKNNVDRRAYDLGWTGPGDLSQFMRITTSSVATKLTSRFVQNERSLRMVSASIGYNFTKYQFIKRLGIRNMQMNLSTNDLIWLSSVQIERGTDNPFYRNYALSLRLSL